MAEPKCPLCGAEGFNEKDDADIRYCETCHHEVPLCVVLDDDFEPINDG